MIYESTTKNLDDQNLEADFSSDFAQERIWLVTFNSSKTKLVMFYPSADSDFSPLLMNNCTLNKAPYIKRLLELTPNHKCNLYIC